MIYPLAPYARYRESPSRSLSAAELADAAAEYVARAQESRKYLERYRRRGNTVRARALVTALNRLEWERQRFLDCQEQLQAQSKHTVLTAA